MADRATVIPIRRGVERICGNCEHGYLGPGGVFCRVYEEDIYNERVAEECEDFEAQGAT